ncbi:IclR family transcriptional regulator [Microbacterium sp. NPDC056044]|uniref:IclR family transcriptional regulator n=1 Tax=Microbacterium sp. NPDC056044 TaxID=3345690 RepID=UPI0035D70F13
MSGNQTQDRVVGAERVLSVLAELAEHPSGISLDDLTNRLNDPKPTVHRALVSLKKFGFATQVSRGVYTLGDEYLRLAFRNYADRPEGLRVEPLLRQLVEQYGETAHYAVLDGADVVYRAKLDPPAGSVRLTSVVGGRNPAHRTAVGKMLLSFTIGSESELRSWLGTSRLEPRTPHSITTVHQLWKELEATRERGYAVDDQENEIGINCVAVPVRLDPALSPTGAVSVSALAFRMPLAELIPEVPRIKELAQDILQNEAR